MIIKNVAIMPSAKGMSGQESRKILSWLQERDIQILLPQGRGESLDSEELETTVEDIRGRADLMLSLGGDGTLLHACKIVAGTHIPILGINLGHLGFLTESNLDD